MSPLLIIIPAYNEEENIEHVVEDVRRECPEYDYIVVNDGSSDCTAAICRDRGYPLLDLPVNLGLSGAFHAGLRYAVRKGYRYVLQFDGDGQHLAKYIRPMLQAAEESGSDIVIGSRYIDGEKGYSLREWGSRLVSLLILLTTGKRVKDPTSGMRMYDAAVVKRMAGQMNYPPEPDTLAYLVRSGAKLTEVPVEMQERLAGASYLTAAASLRYMFYTCASILIVQWFRKRRGE